MELRRSRRLSGEERVVQQGPLPSPVNPVLQAVYYGSLKGKTEAAHGTYEGNLRCGCCLKQFKTSQEIMLHCYGHVKYTMVPGDPEHPDGSCSYCLSYYKTQPMVDAHIQEVHTLTAERFCCRICQQAFPNKGSLIAHMWKLHLPLEIPYSCELCNFGSSLHTDVIDHFQQEHGNSDHIVCPFCLKTLTVRSENCITQLFIHLQSHRVIRNTKCPKCQLVFIKDEDYQLHESFAHKSRTPDEIEPYVVSSFEELIEMPVRRSATKFCYRAAEQ